MSENYLNETGLSRLWNKIKATFAPKDTATTTADGLMSAADKTNLDTLYERYSDKTSANVLSDANSATATGHYLVNANTSNLPDSWSGSGVLEVSRSTSTNYVRQELWANGTYTVYIRRKNGSNGWSDWYALPRPHQIGRVRLTAGESQSFTLTAYRQYLVSMVGATYIVDAKSATATPRIVQIGGDPLVSGLTVTASANATITLSNTTSSTYICQVNNLIDQLV